MTSSASEAVPGRVLDLPGRQRAARVDDLTALLPQGASRPAIGDLLMAAPFNAHDHGYGLRTLDFGSVDDALEAWIPSLRLRPRTDPYLETLVAFARMAKGGIAGTIHCHNSLNADRLMEETLAVVRAAGDVGILLGLSCPLFDFDAWAYDGGPERLKPYLSEADWNGLSRTIPRYAPVEAQIAAVDAVAAANSNPLVSVQYGPIGPQWCSNALLEGIAEASALNGRRIHMHLLESPRQRQWLDRRFPQGIVTYLDDIGFLSPRLAVAHGVQLRPDEYALLAERGVQLASNPTANLRLRSGIAPLRDAVAKGLKFGIGLDGTGMDDDQDLWREMRVAYLLQGDRELTRGFSAAALFHAATSTATDIIGAGKRSDRVVVDYEKLIEDSLFDDVDEAEVLLARMTAGHVRALYVEGREIVAAGRLMTVDFNAARQELMAQARADMPRLRQERGRVRALAEASRAYYAGW
ncbi:amidohydrolase family protein [Mesorhizobium sp. CGMCC 1.15528]|uniref:Amidohydrolase family protein n=1 Tax=Mesorhizobium zhangyense TaxID=1776730 RepID=A0A7C9VF18_9HYPH|nr:amidohydrolase family protein [Mesorhizobium zhangyense]NGN44487.1 amidohydrolase family protein [Mesorhizobium zhangyense]